jgi:hypothetical protein
MIPMKQELAAGLCVMLGLPVEGIQAATSIQVTPAAEVQKKRM